MRAWISIFASGCSVQLAIGPVVDGAGHVGVVIEASQLTFPTDHAVSVGYTAQYAYLASRGGLVGFSAGVDLARLPQPSWTSADHATPRLLGLRVGARAGYLRLDGNHAEVGGVAQVLYPRRRGGGYGLGASCWHTFDDSSMGRCQLTLVVQNYGP